MLIRALIVLLLVLNLGVALWWVARPSPTAPVVPDEPVPGVVRLQLLSETGAEPPAPIATAPVVSRCLALGPFDDAAVASRAQSRLRPRVLQMQPRREYPGVARSWKVMLPPAASMDDAEAAAQRVADAGFKDHFLVRDGEDARSVALGLYRSQSTARERIATLAAAGFDAQLQPVGAGPAEHWLDVGVAAGFDAAAAQALVDAARIEPIDCPEPAPAAAAPAR